MRDAALDLLQEKIHESALESFLVGKRTNIHYITGFSGDFGYAAIGLQEPVFFTSPLYIEHAQSAVGKPFNVVEVNNNVFTALADLGKSFWGKRVGYEAETVTCSDFEKIKNAFQDIELVSTKEMVEEIRAVKKPSEIDSITRAQRISEKVLDEALELVREDILECDLACEIDYRFRKRGGERSAFETIVAFGANSSNPHARPTQKKLKYGDIILFDMGTICDGYASDMTRTMVFGEADLRMKKIYAAVLAAQEAALEGIRAGMKCSEADLLARDVIKKAGYGDQFVHSLGHGVGLDVHESPQLSQRTESLLKQNMVVTVEPGIYIPGWGGIRIEDMIVVTGNGCKNLTNASKILCEL